MCGLSCCCKLAVLLLPDCAWMAAGCSHSHIAHQCSLTTSDMCAKRCGASCAGAQVRLGHERAVPGQLQLPGWASNPRTCGAAGRAPSAQVARAIELRQIVTSLGPAYIKLGQALSIRPDLLSPAAMVEMQKLCDKVSPSPPPRVRTLPARELTGGGGGWRHVQPARRAPVPAIVVELPNLQCRCRSVHSARVLGLACQAWSFGNLETT